ncbi:MAG: hypothetical protein JWO38_3551 [Gemmataceae bacterium]|nr:hypothetical protein [Gemmataceae bacterium]
MSDAFEPRTPAAGQETRQLVSLGDGQADNAKLAATLDKLAERINHDAPGGWHVVSLLRQLMECGWLPCQFAWHVLMEAVNRFTDHEVKLIKVKAEAEKLSAEAEAIRVKATAEAHATIATALAMAEKTRAEADTLRAEAAKKQAEVVQLQTQVGRVDDLCKRLKARGIDWQAEIDMDGKMRIVVAKQPPAGAE